MANEEQFELLRQGYFEDPPHILYAPPGTAVTVAATTEFEFAMGAAPAEGKYSHPACSALTK